MIIVALILSLITAFVMAKYGVKKYRLALAGSFFVNGFVALTYIDYVFKLSWMSPWAWGVILAIIVVITLALLIFSKIATYFLALCMITGLIGWPFEQFGVLDIGGIISGIVSLVVVAVGVVIVFKIRKHLIKVVVGLLSGTSLSFAANLMLFLIVPVEKFEALKIISMMIWLLGWSGGIFFQYKVAPRLFGEIESCAAIK